MIWDGLSEEEIKRRVQVPRKEGVDDEEVDQWAGPDLLKMFLQCSRLKPERRPGMLAVVEEMDVLRQKQPINRRMSIDAWTPVDEVNALRAKLAKLAKENKRLRIQSGKGEREEVLLGGDMSQFTTHDRRLL